MNDVLITIRTNKAQPIKTLSSYFIPLGMPVVIVADPDVVEFHKHREPTIEVVPGAKGLSAQRWCEYVLAAERGFKYFFHMDDDLAPGTFISKEGYPDLATVISAARTCIENTRTTLAGFMNGSNRFWLGEGYGRTYGLIHGGATISISAKDPLPYIRPGLNYHDDVWISLSHRRKDGAVGRVKWIGFDKSKSTKVGDNRSIREDWIWERDLILNEFPGMVTCEGVRDVHAGMADIPNWRMKRHGFIK